MNLFLEEIIKERVKKRTPPGVIFCKVERHGTEYFSYGVNSLDGEQVPDSDTIFEIGSNTKVIVALLFTRLEELGFFSLTDPIRDYLPVTVPLPARDNTPISFLDILTHTSALPRMPPNFDFKNVTRSFAEYGVDDLYVGLEQLSLDWEIGSSYVYSNLGYGLLGHIVEQITDQNLDELLDKYVCKPLAMNSTRFGVGERVHNVATPHQGERPVPLLKFGVLGAAGGLTSSAKDMSKFLSNNLGVLDSELSSAIKKTQQMHYQESAIFGLGIGWHIQQRNGLNIVWHRGETHGQTSFIAFDRQVETGIIMLSNSAFSGCCSDLALSQIDPQTIPTEHEPHAVLNLPLASLRRLEGEYELDAAITFSISAKENYLNVKVTGQAGGLMYPVEPNQFETKDRRVIIRFSDDAEMITIRQHGIDRIAHKSQVSN